MKLIELYYKVDALKHDCRMWSLGSLIGMVDTKSEQKRDSEDTLKLYEKFKSGIKEFEQLTNRMNEALATNYVKVDDAELSLLTAIWYLQKGEAKFTDSYEPTVGAFYNVHLYNHFVPANKADSCETYAPRLRLLRCLDDGSNNISWYEELVEEEGKFLVNPLNISDDYEYQTEFLVKLRAAVMCAMSDIDV